jgi:glucokinase
MDKQVLGLDVGGTAIKLGRFTADGVCQQQITVPTPQPARPEAVAQAIAESIPAIDVRGEAIAIGVGTPGPADGVGRIARIAINLEGWMNVPFAELLETATRLPTVVANDANCAGLGEAWLGAGQNIPNFILLTLGTGVGGAIIMDGDLYTGPRGTAGELGLMTFNPAGPPCNSGNNGSLEQYASAKAIRRQTGQSPRSLSEQAKGGSPEAIAFWNAYGTTLGVGLASLTYVLSPDAIILGGGVAASFELFFPSLKTELYRRVLPSSRESLAILPASLGNQAGMLGAAKLALGKFS